MNSLCTGCRYCDNCSETVPVPKLMDAYNQKVLGSDWESVFNRLRWHWNIQKDDPALTACIECGACEKSCTQKLPIIERLLEIREASQS